MMLAGIDFSTKQIDVAIIPLDETADGPRSPVTFRSRRLEQGDRAERIRSAHTATRSLLADVELSFPISSVWIEEPFGRYRNATNALLPIMGAIAASVPPYAAVALIAVQEWRRRLGLPSNLSKERAVFQAEDWADTHAPPAPGAEWSLTEHQAEALLIALAGRAECWRGAAA